MSLILPKKNIYKTLKLKNLILEKNKLINYFNSTRKRFILYTTQFETTNKNMENHINPFLWQIGHVIFFYIKHVINNLYNFKNIDEYKKYEYLIDFYDSFKTPVEIRNGKLLLDYTLCIKLFNKISEDLKIYINNSFIGPIESYLIFLGILHNEMHNEAFIFTKLNLSNIINFEIKKIDKDEIIDQINFINYKDGIFNQGSNQKNSNFLIFDNEMPEFKKKIKKFSISKYPITEFQFLKFIKNGGYENKKYWSREGWFWKQNNNINLPLYWVNENNEYFKILNNTKFKIHTNLPICNISYHEAKAFCNWSGYRLPIESEYEYVSTNCGTTIYPWGNEYDNNKANINYKQFIVPVNNFKNGDNYKKVSQLIGNIWEWCEESIYPYQGFKIDPVYREMSYPFFGFKKICKGGCFAVPDFLIHPKYRNSQYPDCRIQFIGFRVCK